jgi:methionyl-tRNA formyltransferase
MPALPPMPDLRIIFMGTAELACASLETLAAQPDFKIIAVVTQPDRPKGRDLKLAPSAVKETALRLGLPVLQPERARHEGFIAELRQLQPDLIVVAAYGQILPQSILDLPRFGCLNVHTSLLPKYRGAAPIQWAILNGDLETGVTIMKMDAGMDTGPILTQHATPIRTDDNSQTLHDRLATMGAELLLTTLRDLIAGKIDPQPQPAEGASHARKITREDGRIDWTKPAGELLNRIRAFTPWPGAFTFMPGTPQPHLLKIREVDAAEGAGQPGEILKADKTGIVVACGDGALRISSLQREGGRRMSAGEFLTGHRLTPGEKLG